MFIESLLLSAALTSPQTAYTNEAPIRVAACDLAYTPSIPLGFGNTLAGGNSLSISFVNQADKPIVSVAFDVTAGGTTSRIVDKGTFSSGTQINHSFNAYEFRNSAGDVACALKSVAFADGSTWQAQ